MRRNMRLELDTPLFVGLVLAHGNRATDTDPFRSRCPKRRCRLAIGTARRQTWLLINGGTCSVPPAGKCPVDAGSQP